MSATIYSLTIPLPPYVQFLPSLSHFSLFHVSTSVSRPSRPSRISPSLSPSIWRYEASRIRSRPDPLSQTGFSMASTCKACIVVPPLPPPLISSLPSSHPLLPRGSSPPSQKSFLPRALALTRPRDYSSQYAGARAGAVQTHARAGRHACVHTRPRYPISLPLGHRNPPRRARRSAFEARASRPDCHFDPERDCSSGSQRVQFIPRERSHPGERVETKEKRKEKEKNKREKGEKRRTGEKREGR